MELLAQRFQRDFKVFDKWVGLVLAVECVFVRILNRVLGTVVDLPERGCQVCALELGESIGHKDGLHELLSHADVEKRARLLPATHLDDAPLLVEINVGETAHGNRKGRVLASLRGGNDDVGHADELFFHCSVIFWLFLRHVSFLSFGYVSRLLRPFQNLKSFALRSGVEL
jgi:hypothetical protein